MTQDIFDSVRTRTLVRLALEEDAVDADVTSRGVVPADARGSGTIVAKSSGVLAGLPLLAHGSPLTAAFPSLMTRTLLPEGARLSPGDRVAEISGSARELLGIERTMLNFTQRMTGVATATAAYVEAVRGTKARIQETRKTCPGWRDLDKYSVRVGGGLNHRRGLSDQVLVKENHLMFAGMPMSPDAVRLAVKLARGAAPPGTPVEIEVETLEQLDAALEAAADIVLLDNMTPDLHAEAVRRRDRRGAATLIEASGGITMATVRAVAESGVDRISVGALTHSVVAADLSFDLVPAPR